MFNKALNSSQSFIAVLEENNFYFWVHSPPKPYPSFCPSFYWPPHIDQCEGWICCRHEYKHQWSGRQWLQPHKSYLIDEGHFRKDHNMLSFTLPYNSLNSRGSPSHKCQRRRGKKKYCYPGSTLSLGFGHCHTLTSILTGSSWTKVTKKSEHLYSGTSWMTK